MNVNYAKWIADEIPPLHDALGGYPEVIASDELVKKIAAKMSRSPRYILKRLREEYMPNLGYRETERVKVGDRRFRIFWDPERCTVKEARRLVKYGRKEFVV